MGNDDIQVVGSKCGSAAAHALETLRDSAVLPCQPCNRLAAWRASMGGVHGSRQRKAGNGREKFLLSRHPGGPRDKPARNRRQAALHQQHSMMIDHQIRRRDYCKHFGALEGWMTACACGSVRLMSSIVGCNACACGASEGLSGAGQHELVAETSWHSCAKGP